MNIGLLYQQTAAAAITTNYQRELLHRIDWKHRLIAIREPRGVGKTTLLLQHLKMNGGAATEALYVTLDDLFFTENRLIDLAREFQAKGGKGKNKDFRQIKSMENAFVVADDVEIGFDRKIPLWLFGFLY